MKTNIYGEIVNAGYVIIEKERYYIDPDGSEFYIVLGMNSNGNYVTWESTNLKSYYWGHYITDPVTAKIDYHERLIENYKHPQF